MNPRERAWIELRKAGIIGQILILGYTLPQRFYDLLYYSLTQTVVDFSYAKIVCWLTILKK